MFPCCKQAPHQKPKDFLAPWLRRRSYPCFEQGLTEWCTNDGVFQEMHQKCVICEAWNQSKYLIWATFVKQLSSFRGLSRLLRTLVCKNCSNEPRLTQYFYPLGNFGASPPLLPTPHFTFRITRPNHTFACSSIREESRIAFCQTWTSSLFAISASFWLSKLDHKQHFWARLVSQKFSNHILQPNCRGRTTKCVGGWGGRFFSLGIVWNILVGYPPILLMHCWKYCNVSRMLKTYWNVQVVVEQPHKTQLQLAVPPSNVN